MTECIDGVCYMTDQVQFSTMVVALFMVFLIALGTWAIVRQIIEEDIKAATQRDIDQFTEEMYLHRKAVRLEATIPGQLISPQGLAWLERKLGL